MKEELKIKVFEAIGEATMCWDPKPTTQVFDSGRAIEIGNKLWKEIEKVLNEKAN